MPEPAACWSGVLSAKHFGPAACPIHDMDTRVPYGEDHCLTVNVMAPAEPPPPGGYPTVFFVHPAAWSIGSAMWMRFAGFCDNIVSQGIVVVTFNHRLAQLGSF